MLLPFLVLFDGENVRKTGDFKNIRNGIVYIAHNHFALLIHHLFWLLAPAGSDICFGLAIGKKALL